LCIPDHAFGISQSKVDGSLEGFAVIIDDFARPQINFYIIQIIVIT